MRIKSLELENYRCFEKFSIDFDEKLTVIVAENGVGKSSVLDALAVALSPFVGGFDSGINKGFRRSDAKLKITDSQSSSLMKDMESIYPVIVQAKAIIESEEYIWKRALSNNKKGSKTTVKDAKNIKDYGKKLQDLVRENREVDLPIVSFYGTDRLWNSKTFTNTNKGTSSNSQSRLWGYNRALEHASTYKAFHDWFIAESKAEYDLLIEQIQSNSMTTIQPIEESKSLASIREAVNICLEVSQWNNIRYNSKFKTITVTHPEQGTMPVSRLSDGVRSMLAMTADIAYRCTKLNPHLENAPKETKGIVKIDEVDLHLHPRWQQVVIPNLQKAFPKIQFIITTHSPQVLSSIKNEAIRIISDSQVYAAPLGTEGAEASRILKRVFGVELRAQNNSITIKLNRYLDLVYDDQWECNEALVLRKELENLFSGEEPALTEADLYIENRKWEMESEEGS
jgi:predicted ATP-binding protein involved in virulence